MPRFLAELFTGFLTPHEVCPLPPIPLWGWQTWDAEEDPGLFCLNLEGWACLTVGLSATSKADPGHYLRELRLLSGGSLKALEPTGVQHVSTHPHR